jgi:tRNA 2-thiocytidine biosynthesis protein TtcA
VSAAKQTRAATVVQKLAVKAIRAHNLVQNGDKILIAASGGKDSTVMAWALASCKAALKIDYELSALHISTDFCSCCKKADLESRLAAWGVPFTDKFVPVIGRLKAGQKMNCYWCSTQRRAELIKFARENGYNKIALGHHADDIIETFFMNMLNKGELLAMPFSLAYNKYPVTLIRPLGYAQEAQIIEAARELDCLKSACTCPYGRNSKRREARSRITSLTSGSLAQKRRIINALEQHGLLKIP